MVKFSWRGHCFAIACFAYTMWMPVTQVRACTCGNVTLRPFPKFIYSRPFCLMAIFLHPIWKIRYLSLVKASHLLSKCSAQNGWTINYKPCPCFQRLANYVAGDLSNPPLFHWNWLILPSINKAIFCKSFNIFHCCIHCLQSSSFSVSAYMTPWNPASLLVCEQRCTCLELSCLFPADSTSFPV